jgi:RNA polymerase sigma factor (sigma-70 family)
MPHLSAGQPDPAEYEFLHLFFREVSKIDIIPGRAAYLPLTRRIERGRTLEKLGGQNPFETFSRLAHAYRQICGRIDALTTTHCLPKINLSTLNDQAEDFLDQPDAKFPPALTKWVEKLPKNVQNEAELVAWELIWLTALIPPERRSDLPQAAFSTAYVFHFNDVRRQAADSLRRLTEGTLRYALTIAQLYVGRGIPYLDLIHAGCIGLMRAANLFTERGGAHFQHYASNWIRQRIDRYLTDTSNLIRLPVHAQTDMQAVRRFVHKFKRRKGFTPTDGEVALGLGWVTEEDLYEAVAADTLPETVIDDMPNEEPDDESEDDISETPVSFQYTRSAHKAIGRVRRFRAIANVASLERSGGVTRLADDQFSLSNVVESRLLRDTLMQALGGLHPRAAEILTLRYGLEDGEMRTLEEIGQLMGVTRERVRQIEAGALGKLRISSLLGSLAHLEGFEDECSLNLPNYLSHPRRARYTPPRQERQWVEDLKARYIERGRRGKQFSTVSQRGRARIYAEVLREAGKPLPYRDIHARAVERYPDLAELPLKTIYSTLFYHDAFRLTKGRGVFGLTEWQTADVGMEQTGRGLFPRLIGLAEQI